MKEKTKFVVKDTAFDHFIAGDEGALLFVSSISANSKINFENCKFVNLVSMKRGGVISI